MKLQEVLEQAKNNGRKVRLIYVGKGLPVVGFCKNCDWGELMSLNLGVFAQEVWRREPGTAFIIGRHTDSDFRLPNDARYSRIHCVIAFYGGSYHVYDCSLCGTDVK